MNIDKNKKILVDTNCLVRVYFSPLRPVLSNVAAGYEFKTLQELADELKNVAKRRAEYAWLAAKDIQDDVKFAVLNLSAAQQEYISDETDEILEQGDGLLLAYCVAKGINVRKLSLADARALATAFEMDMALATDEWPLRYVASLYSNDNGDRVELFCSVELIALLEKEGLLSKEERKKTYAEWLKFGEKLLRDSPQIYWRLFQEKPPTGQF